MSFGEEALTILTGLFDLHPEHRLSRPEGCSHSCVVLTEIKVMNLPWLSAPVNGQQQEPEILYGI